MDQDPPVVDSVGQNGWEIGDDILEPGLPLEILAPAAGNPPEALLRGFPTQPERTLSSLSCSGTAVTSSKNLIAC